MISAFGLIASMLPSPLGFLRKYWRIILLVIVVGLSVFGINLAVNKYTDTVAKLGETKQALAEKTAAYSALEADFTNYMAVMGREIARANDTILGLQRKSVENRREYDELADKFEKHDLAFLAKRKPGLVSGVINRGTSRVFSALESGTREFATGGAAGSVPAPDPGQPAPD